MLGAGALAIAACDAQPKGADGYRFGEAEFTREDLQVRIVQYDTRSAFEQAARAQGIEKIATLAAFGTVEMDRPACTIHAMRIAEHYEPEWLGHELAHCIHGRWHK